MPRAASLFFLCRQAFRTGALPYSADGISYPTLRKWFFGNGNVYPHLANPISVCGKSHFNGENCHSVHGNSYPNSANHYSVYGNSHSKGAKAISACGLTQSKGANPLFLDQNTLLLIEHPDCLLKSLLAAMEQ